MSEWQEVTLNDIGLLARGKSKHRPRYAFHLYDGPYPFVQTGEIRSARKYIREYEKTYSEEGLKQSKLWKKGTLCITIAANIAEIGILDFDACFPDSVIGFVPDQTKADLDFIYYSLQHFQKELKHRGEGSVQDNINLGTFNDMMFPLPELEEQKAISAVLASLDDKISLLHRQNKTLEALTQTLFRHWFIDNAEDDWEEKPLSDIANVQNGYAFRSKDYVEYEPGHLEVFKMGHIEPGGGLRFAPKRDYIPRTKKLMRWVMDEGDIVMAMTDMKDSMGILAHPAMIDKSDTYVLNQRVARISLKNDKYLPDNYLLYLQLANHDTRALLQSMAHGGVQVNLSTASIQSTPIIIPSKEELKEKFPVLKNHQNKMKANRKQIQTLEKLRETLLPKLMSGEVRVAL